MRLGDLYNKIRDIDAFSHWFNGSKVVDAHGNPQVMYHVTDRDLDVFKPLTHFGDATTVYDRWSDQLMQYHFSGRNLGTTYPVVLSIKNPFEITDAGYSHTPKNLLWAAQVAKVISREDASAVRNDKPVTKEKIIQALMKTGYDGIKYINRVEGDGGYSWIVFDSGQVKSIYSKGFNRHSPDIMESNT